MNRLPTGGTTGITEKSRPQKAYISPIWGDDPLRTIFTKMVWFTHIHDVIKRSKFGVDRLTRLGATGS